MQHVVFRISFLALVFFSCSHVMGQMKAYQCEVNGSTEMQYLLYSPAQASEKYPLVIFLHGGGEGGNDIEKVKSHGFPKLIDQGADFPFYMLAPQNPYISGFWDDRAVDQMVEGLLDTLNIDTNRIYLTGLSRGGYGVWRMALNNPDKYAAMISICAASIPMSYVKRLNTTPVWLFHGQKDPIIPVEQSQLAYEILKPINSNAELTIYPEAEHDSWTATFENPKVIEWLLSWSK